MKRALLDLKSPDGPGGVPAPGRDGPTWSSRASGPAWSTGSASATTASGPATRAIVYCSTPATARTGPTRQWAGHDLNYLAVGGFLDCQPAGRGRQAAGPRRHRRRQRRRRHARGHVDPRRARAPAQRARAPTSTCRSPTASSRSCRSTSTSTSPPAPCPGHRPHHASPAATPATTPTGRRRRLDRGGRHRAASSGPTSAGCSASSSGSTDQPDDDVQDEIRADVARRRSPPRPATSGSRCWRPADTCVAPVLSVAEVVDDPQFAAGRVRRGGAPDARHVPPGRPDARRARSAEDRYELRDGDRDRHRRAARRRRLLAPTRSPSCARQEPSHDETRSPTTVTALIGVPQYEEAGEFPVERGYIWTVAARSRTATRSSGTTRSPHELTGGPIAPPTMISLWFRPHHWAPGRTEQKLPVAGALRPQGAARHCPRRS